MATILNFTQPLSSTWPAPVFAFNAEESYRLSISTYFAVGALSVRSICLPLSNLITSNYEVGIRMGYAL